MELNNWLTLVGVFPPGYNVCGIYAEDGTIIEVAAGNTFTISGDFYSCFDVAFFIYFETSAPDPIFGRWTIYDMHDEEIFSVMPTPCSNQ